MLLGIDLGTTTIKAVLLAEDGRIAGSAALEYESLYPHPDWVEQDPQIWLNTLSAVMQQLWADHPNLSTQVKAAGLSGQMHGIVLVDEAGNYLRPAIIWADSRSRAQADWLIRELGQTELARMTGNPIFPGFMLPSLLWVRENEPEIWQECCKVLLPKDYLRLFFTGKYHSEPSDASSTGLFDVYRRTWNFELAERLSIPVKILPGLIESAEIIGELLPRAAERLGLPPGLPVVCGGSDQACQALGNGIIEPGQVSCTIGTGGQIFAPLAVPDADPQSKLHLFCHIIPGVWHYEAATLSAGLSLRWLRDLSGAMSYSQMVDAASQVMPGAEGLLFAPFLQGERTPYMDADVRGGFVGLSIRHRMSHITRSLMEGVVFSLREGLDLIRQKADLADRIVASGGACRHPLWLQLMADIFEKPVVTARYVEPAAVGAAMLAGIGAGVYRNTQDAVERICRYSTPLMPKMENLKIYREVYKKYSELYAAMKRFSYRY